MDLKAVDEKNISQTNLYIKNTLNLKQGLFTKKY